jgi:hypothetical protein
MLNKIIIAGKKMVYDNCIKKSDNKLNTTWKIINTEIGRTSKHDDTQHLTEKFNGQNVAELINKYFISVANKLTNSVNSKQRNSSVTNFLSFMEQAITTNYPKIHKKPSTVKEIEKIINSLKTKDSRGYDQISLRILKLSAPYISSPLNYICNTIIQSGTFPERLKYSVVKHLYKKGDKLLISNYRPISLLTSFSKIMEKVMFDRLMNHLKKYAILSPNQYGFQKNLSIDNAVYSLLNKILTALNNKSKAKGIFYDIEKAFDCVNHNILHHKLESYGINRNIQKLIFPIPKG